MFSFLGKKKKYYNEYLRHIVHAQDTGLHQSAYGGEVLVHTFKSVQLAADFDQWLTTHTLGAARGGLKGCSVYVYRNTFNFIWPDNKFNTLLANTSINEISHQLSAALGQNSLPEIKVHRIDQFRILFQD